MSDVKRFFEPNERRYKTLWLSADMVLNFVFTPRLLADGTAIIIKKIEGIPEGCKVQAVTYSFDRDSFGFRLYHPSFDEVEPGMEEPHAMPEFHTERMRVIPKLTWLDHAQNSPAMIDPKWKEWTVRDTRVAGIVSAYSTLQGAVDQIHCAARHRSMGDYSACVGDRIFCPHGRQAMEWLWMPERWDIVPMLPCDECNEVLKTHRVMEKVEALIP